MLKNQALPVQNASARTPADQTGINWAVEHGAIILENPRSSNRFSRMQANRSSERLNLQMFRIPQLRDAFARTGDADQERRKARGW